MRVLKFVPDSSSHNLPEFHSEVAVNFTIIRNLVFSFSMHGCVFSGSYMNYLDQYSVSLMMSLGKKRRISHKSDEHLTKTTNYTIVPYPQNHYICSEHCIYIRGMFILL